MTWCSFCIIKSNKQTNQKAEETNYKNQIRTATVPSTTFSYTHRSVFRSAVIRETSCCSRWEPMQRRTTTPYAECEALVHAVLKEMPSLILALKAQGSMRKRRQQYESQRYWLGWLQESCLPSTVKLVDIWIHTDCVGISKSCTRQSQAGSQHWTEEELSHLTN